MAATSGARLSMWLPGSFETFDWFLCTADSCIQGCHIFSVAALARNFYHCGEESGQAESIDELLSERHASPNAPKAMPHKGWRGQSYQFETWPKAES